MNVIDRKITGPEKLTIPQEFNLKILGGARGRISLLMHNREDLLATEAGQKVRCFLGGEKKFSVVCTKEGNLYASLAPLGGGMSKKVKVGLRLNDLVLVALGKMKPGFLESEYKREISMLQQFQDNQGVVKLLESYKTQSSTKDQRANIQEKQVMVTEFCDGATLFNYRKKKSQSPQEQRFLFERFEEIIETLVKVHEKGVVHLDIKLENIFLSEGNAKIGDFGSAKKEGEPGLGGTPVLLPIEAVFAYSKRHLNTTSAELMNFPDESLLKHRLLEDKSLLTDGKQDVWSFGMALCEAFFGNFFTEHLSKDEGFIELGLGSSRKTPIETLKSMKNAYLKIDSEKILFILNGLPARSEIEKKVVEILRKTLVLDPLLRPSAQQIKDFIAEIA